MEQQQTPVRIAEFLAPLSLVMDLGMGSATEEAMRTCLLATGLGRRTGLPEDAVSDVYFTALLRHLGCTATAHDEALHFAGDELALRPLIGPTDFGRPREMMRLMTRAGAGQGYSPLKRARLVVRMATSNAWGAGIERGVCEVAAMLAERLGFAGEVQEATGQSFERWDGRGNKRLAGEDISIAARFVHVAGRAVAFHTPGEPEAAMEAVRQSAGGWLDPGIAAAFETHGPELLREVDEADPLPAVLDREPTPRESVDETGIDNLVRTFGDMVDLKSTYTFGHSAGVAALAEHAAETVGCSPDEVRNVRHIAMLHDLGRAGVPGGVWEKPGALTTTERERMRLHPCYTERILARVPRFAAMASVAGMHHERLDGSGYHRGAVARDIPLAARILAAVDAFHTMIGERPHRPAYPVVECAERLAASAAAGSLDADVVRAVVAAAGREVPAFERALPAGITERELEVLRLVAKGHSNREIADALVISPRTAEHHVQHIYDKIGVSTRAAASMFAMQHDLIVSPLVLGDAVRE